MPTDFLCFAKESQQKRRPGRRPSAACGDGGPRFSKVRAATEMARRLRRRLAVTDSPLTFCDAQRALRGENGDAPPFAHDIQSLVLWVAAPTAQTVRQLCWL